MFSGSYATEDVEFLLKPISVEWITDLAHKEALIQSGQRHYSEMLSPEALPSTAYLALFYQAHQAHRADFARDCLRLAQALYRRYGADITLVSLARAGTPIGVILRRLLRQHYGIEAPHYSLSIIRDRGIDEVALTTILARGHAPASLAFIDGWTGKGVISRELASAIQTYNHTHQLAIHPGLNVLTDLAGTAALAASGEDYLIASSLLNATISGLVSRSVLNASIGPEDYHGCVFFDQWLDQDISRWFVDDVLDAAKEVALSDLPPAPAFNSAHQAALSHAYMQAAQQRYCIDDENLIKPGIGEATRVLLRRHPERVLVRDLNEPSVQHLLALAEEKQVVIEQVASLPYRAVSIIRSARDA